MERSHQKCVCRLLQCVWVVLAAAIAFEPAALNAAMPDVPRIQAEAEKGSIRHEIQLGASYLTGFGVPQDSERAAFWYERAANAGDPLAQIQIGYFYQAGIGVPRNLERAAQWYQRAASAGLMQAKVNLGVAYLWGTGVKKDPDLAYQLIHDAAVRGSGLASAYLGDMFYFGIGVPMDRSVARDWYERGARLDDSIAECRLGALLATPDSSKPDLPKAARLFRQSVKGGYVEAQHLLGLLLIQHPELPAQPNEGLELLQKSSAAGVWRSSALLGALSRDGQGTARDHARAFYYFQLAQLQGGEPARLKVKNDLAILRRELFADRLTELEDQASEWVRKHPLTLQFQYKDTVGSKDFPIFALSAAKNDTHVGQLIPAPPGSDEP